MGWKLSVKADLLTILTIISGDEYLRDRIQLVGHAAHQLAHRSDLSPEQAATDSRDGRFANDRWRIDDQVAIDQGQEIGSLGQGSGRLRQ